MGNAAKDKYLVRIDATKPDPVAAECAGLTHVTDDIPGITRQRRAEGWDYRRPDGTEIVDPAERARIDAIGIPPAWTQVWISPAPNGHILATGRDSRGRKQYRYHPHWQEVQDRTKYHRMGEFGQALPSLRRHVDRDLDLPGLPREKVLGAVVRLMDETLIRIGNEEYARQNDSFGLTTLRHDHVEFEGPTTIAAVVLETIPGTAGIMPPPPWYTPPSAAPATLTPEFPSHPYARSPRDYFMAEW